MNNYPLITHNIFRGDIMNRLNSSKCSHFKPMSDLPYHIKSHSCSHCAFYNTKNCHKNFYDYLDYPDDD